MRGRLQALIDYTGLSIGEAAAVCGVGHEALSRKLSGKERYEVREAEVAALEAVAAWQDNQVRAILGRVAHMAAERGAPPEDICMVQYRRNEDMLEPNGPPASAQRMIIARLSREPAVSVIPVVFDPVTYHAWRAGRLDTHALRGEWAARSKIDYKLSIKLGGNYPYDLGKAGSNAMGWMLVQINRDGDLIEAGEDTISN